MKSISLIALFTLLILSGICIPLSQASAQPATYTYYLDNDGDGYGYDASAISIVETTPPEGYTTLGGDCHDDNASVHPGATEICGNVIDDNCDGVVDPGCLREQLPDFTKKDIYGVSHHFYGDLAAGKAVVIEFSTGWCPFTNIAEPQISNIYDDICQGQGNIKLYDIIFETETPGHASDDAYGVVYANHHNATYPVIANSQDVYNMFAYQYSIGSIPTFFVIIPNVNDPAKSTVYKIEGALEDLKDRIENILTSHGYTITPPPPLNITVTGNVCDFPSPVTLTSNQPSGNRWSTGETTRSITISAPGVYSLSYTAGCGTITKKVYIAGNVTTTTLSSSSATACAGGNGIFALTYGGEHPDAVLQYSLDGTNWITYREGFEGEIYFFNQWSAGTTVSFRVKERVSNSVGLPDCDAYSNVVQIVSQQLPGQAFEITANNSDCSFPKTLISPYSDNIWSTEETTQSISINSPGFYYVLSNANCGQLYDYIIVNSESSTWYRDADKDGFGDKDITTEACVQPSGYVPPEEYDCNDGDASIFPGAPEICDNGKDDNCDGQIDEGCTAYTFYLDDDGDGYGKTNFPTTIINPTPPSGYAALDGDCNDGDASVNPGATEICDGIDNNCNGQIDEGVPAITYYRDKDGDGYGNPAVTTTANCNAPVPRGYVRDNTDCNDSKAGIKPGAVEICGNGIDDNCNGQVDEGCPAPITISINDVSVYESQGTAILTVSLSITSTQTVQVKYTTGNKGTANAGKDYTNTKGTLIIPAGSLSKTISVPVLQDNIREQAEYFDVQLTQPVNATFSDAVGRVTILDDVAPMLNSVEVSHLSLSVDKEPTAGGLKVHAWPNPSTNRFALLTQSGALETLQVRVFNNLGQIVETRNGIAANGTLYLGTLYSPGVYFVEITQSKQRQVLKLIKQ